MRRDAVGKTKAHREFIGRFFRTLSHHVDYLLSRRAHRLKFVTRCRSVRKFVNNRNETLFIGALTNHSNKHRFGIITFYDPFFL